MCSQHRVLRKVLLFLVALITPLSVEGTGTENLAQRGKLSLLCTSVVHYNCRSLVRVDECGIFWLEKQKRYWDRVGLDD